MNYRCLRFWRTTYIHTRQCQTHTHKTQILIIHQLCWIPHNTGGEDASGREINNDKTILHHNQSQPSRNGLPSGTYKLVQAVNNWSKALPHGTCAPWQPYISYPQGDLNCLPSWLLGNNNAPLQEGSLCQRQDSQLRKSHETT